jgi:small subunit ribosomal protein S18
MLKKRRRPSSDMNSKKRKKCPFTAAGIKIIDYKDVETLSQFITERGKILPRRITGVSHFHQRLLTEAIKKARHVALLPFAADE